MFSFSVFMIDISFSDDRQLAKCVNNRVRNQRANDNAQCDDDQHFSALSFWLFSDTVAKAKPHLIRCQGVLMNYLIIYLVHTVDVSIR